MTRFLIFIVSSGLLIRASYFASSRLFAAGTERSAQPGFIITMMNNSKSLIYYLLKRPRNIDYDPGNHTLSIGLYEKEQPQDIKVDSSPFEPEQITILPDTTLQWQYLIPLWIKKIRHPSGLRESVEVYNFSDVQKVVCTVARDTKPFQANPSDKREEAVVALCNWGETVSASFERRCNSISERPGVFHPGRLHPTTLQYPGA
jgi:hypothetical protein